jgi:glycosyltransferase involved in cell wall biosynthesis
MTLLLQNPPRPTRTEAPPPRVVIATIERPQGDTGIHAHTNALLDGLTRAGIDAELANPFSAGAKWLPIFAIRKLIKPINKSWGLRWYRHWHSAALRECLMQSMLNHAANVVIAQCPVSAQAAIDLREQWKLDFKIALVCHFNYSEATEYRDKGELKSRKTFDRMLEQEARVLQSVDHAIYVSNWAQHVVETERRINPKRSRVIWNGIATDDRSPALSRSDIGVGENELMLINVGSLEPRKNQIELLDLFKLVQSEHANARLVLVGDGAQRTEIEKKICDYQLTDSVILLGHRTDVPALLKLADVYVHYSKLENCPVILLEAARAGLPIAAIPAGGVGEIGAQLGGIVHLHERDANASLTALRPLLSDSTLRQSLGVSARRGFDERFTRDAMVQQYLDELELSVAEAPR